MLNGAQCSCVQWHLWHVRPAPETPLIWLFAAHTAVISRRHVLRWRVTAITLHMIVVASGREPCRGANHGKRVVFPHWWWERERQRVREGERARAVNCVSRSMSVLNISRRVIHSNMNAGRQAAEWSTGSRLVTLNKPCPIPQGM